MPFKILFVSATQTEADILKKIRRIEILREGFRFDYCEINSLVTGVGSIATAWALTKWFSSNESPDVVINAGIAGSFCDYLKPGDVVVPVSDCFADAGIEDGNKFMTLAEAGLSDPDSFPFTSGKIICKNRFSEAAVQNLRPVNAITVNTASGSELTIKNLKEKFNPEIETLEGATFFYICAREKVPFLAVRAISNKIEPRDKSKWDIPLALKSLTEKMEDLLLTLD